MLVGDPLPRTCLTLSPALPSSLLLANGRFLAPEVGQLVESSDILSCAQSNYIVSWQIDFSDADITQTKSVFLKIKIQIIKGEFPTTDWEIKPINWH